MMNKKVILKSLLDLTCMLSAFGAGAQNLDVTGSAKIMGKLELFNAPADSSIFIGTDSGSSDDGANENTFVGYRAGASNTSGKLNIFFGHEAGENNKTGSSNAFLGFQAGIDNISGRHNVFLGFKAGNKNTLGDENVFIGFENGKANTEGTYNTFVGAGAGLVNLTANFNTMIGGKAGNFNTTGASNTFIGYESGFKCETGTANTFVGLQSGSNNQSGDRNTFIGNLTGSGNSTGIENTMVGHSAGIGNSDGQRNAFVGYLAGQLNGSGDNNTYLGYATGFNSSGSGNVFIGFQAGFDETGNNKLYIDNSGTGTPLIYGDFATNRLGVNRIATTNTLEVGGTASKAVAGDWLAHSDRRLKKNIYSLESEDILQHVLKMQGVTYEWNDDKTGIGRPLGTMYGFIAQDLQLVWPSKVSADSQGYLQTAYGDYDPMLVEAIKALYARNQQLEDQIRETSADLRNLTSAILMFLNEQTNSFDASLLRSILEDRE